MLGRETRQSMLWLDVVSLGLEQNPERPKRFARLVASHPQFDCAERSGNHCPSPLRLMAM